VTDISVPFVVGVASPREAAVAIVVDYNLYATRAAVEGLVHFVDRSDKRLAHHPGVSYGLLTNPVEALRLHRGTRQTTVTVRS